MKTLIVAEHDNQSLKAATLNAVAAAQQLGGDVDVLVVGSGCEGAANAAAAVAGVGTVLSADNSAYESQDVLNPGGLHCSGWERCERVSG